LCETGVKVPKYTPENAHAFDVGETMKIRPIIVVFALCAAAAQAETPLAVQIVAAQSTPDVVSFSLTGDIRARETRTIAFSSGGRIAEMLVQAGGTVEHGEPLARIESLQQEQTLRAAEAGLVTAGADYRQAMEDLSRLETLFERGATTRAARDAAEDALGIATGLLAQAKAEHDRAAKALADTVLLAPANATVTQRMAEPGQVVGAAQPVLELALDAGFEAVFDVPEVMLTGNVPSSDISLSRIADPDTRFSGTVSEVSPLVDPKTGTVAVTVAITDPPPGLAVGEAVRGSADRTLGAHITLPYTAISATERGPAVWRVDPATMTVTLQNVTIDRYETGRIILSGGIEEGAMIVAEGSQLLYPGRAVSKAEALK
jgi:RND family efflux transporter MFP subunit